MRYLLDTNMILLYLRQDTTALSFEFEYKILNNNNLALISIVTKGELLALAFKNN